MNPVFLEMTLSADALMGKSRVILVPIRKKRNSTLAITESPYSNYPTDCCPSNHMNMMNPPGQSPHHGDQHHMMGMMATHHGGMANMQPIQQQHPQQQHQQHFSPPGGGPGGNRNCAGCGTKIMDRYLLHALDRYWHNGCLKCSCCQVLLADIGTSCFTKGGMILCKNDYLKLFGSGGACSACGQGIPASDYVMRAQNNVYHLKCFTCVKCHNQLVPGDRYNLVNGSVLCEQDCIKMLKGTVSPAGVRKTKMRVNSAIKV